jgi:DNA-directed RNA polymerase subunit RPC12/RpoP
MTKKIALEDIIKLAKSRNHELINQDTFEQDYKNVKSKLNFKCNTCGQTFSTSLHSYKNAKKTGCPNCKKLIIQQTHKGKTFSEETKAKIAEKARQRPGSLTGVTGSDHPRYSGGYARDKNQLSNADYVWRNDVRKFCEYACVLTGQKKNLEHHHLYSWDKYIDRRYDILNGVLLSKEVHLEFHREYGFGNNTEEQFVEFAKKKYNVDWFAKKQTLLNKLKK